MRLTSDVCWRQMLMWRLWKERKPGIWGKVSMKLAPYHEVKWQSHEASIPALPRDCCPFYPSIIHVSICRTMDQSAFLKKLPVKVLGGRCLSVWGPRSPLPPPPLHTVWILTPVLIHTGKGAGSRWTSEKVRGALVHKRGRKYQHDWTYILSRNSIKHK